MWPKRHNKRLPGLLAAELYSKGRAVTAGEGGGGGGAGAGAGADESGNGMGGYEGLGINVDVVEFMHEMFDVGRAQDKGEGDGSKPSFLALIQRELVIGVG
jgi:hypothetical protein